MSKKTTNHIVQTTDAPASKYTFTVDDGGKKKRVYHGFTGLGQKSKAVDAPLLVIAWFDGEPECWLVENDKGVQELRRYYVDDWGKGREIPMLAFQRIEASKEGGADKSFRRNAGYMIVAERPASNAHTEICRVVLGRLLDDPKSMTDTRSSWVTWIYNTQDGGYSSGNYFHNTVDAAIDFASRGKPLTDRLEANPEGTVEELCALRKIVRYIPREGTDDTLNSLVDEYNKNFTNVKRN